jgi:predicted aldo/keto reductase-like oxidoreductase
LTIEGLSPRRIFGDAPGSFGRIVYRQLGSTGFLASEIGFGAMNMRDPELVHAAIDAGINYIDTAHRYMNGVNEEIIGEVMKTKRDRVFLTTKIKPGTPDEILDRAATSLKRLKTDHVDMFMLHNLDDPGLVLDEAAMKTFDRMRSDRMCRFVGVSTHQNQAAILDAAVATKFWQAALVGYNYMSTQDVADAIRRTREAGLAVIGMKNLLNIQTRQPLGYPPGLRKSGLSFAQAAIRWVLDDPYVDTVVPGMTAFDHLAEDVAVMGLRLGFDDRRMLRRYGERSRGSYCHGVSGCDGCSGQCPKGVDVRGINRCIGYVVGYGDARLARENFDDLPSSSRLAACDDCDECVVRCVNGLDIAANIRLARRLFA